MLFYFWPNSEAEVVLDLFLFCRISNSIFLWFVHFKFITTDLNVLVKKTLFNYLSYNIQLSLARLFVCFELMFMQSVDIVINLYYWIKWPFLHRRYIAERQKQILFLTMSNRVLSFFLECFDFFDIAESSCIYKGCSFTLQIYNSKLKTKLDFNGLCFAQNLCAATDKIWFLNQFLAFSHLRWPWGKLHICQ